VDNKGGQKSIGTDIYVIKDNKQSNNNSMNTNFWGNTLIYTI